MIDWTDQLTPDATRHAPDEAADYAALITDLIQAMHIRDDAQWYTGDRLQGIETRYREKTIENIAEEIGRKAKTVYRWRDLAAFYVPTIRAHYKEQGLFWSHFREAYRLGNIDDAYDFLDECVANHWTVTGAAMAIKARLGEAIPAAAIKATVTITHDVNGRVILTGVDIPDGAYSAILRMIE